MRYTTWSATLLGSIALATGAVNLGSPALAAEQCFPDEMTIVISHSVGSSQNQTTRALGKYLSERLDTQFLYENRPGASGRVGYDYFMTQPKDGSVILSSNQASASIMYAQQNPDWNWRESLVPLGVFTVDPGAIFVSEDSEFESFEEIIQTAEEQPLSLAISYWASPENLQIHQIMDATGAEFEIVPIDSSTELVTQVMGGHLDFGYTKVAAVERGGESLRVVAVPLASNPVPHLTNDAPTVDEVIDANTMGIASYRALLAHKEWVDANPECADQLREAIQATVQDERFIKEMGQLGVDPELVLYMGTDQIYEEVLNRYWAAFEKFGDIYEQQ